jgi:hypothetical protein
VVFYNEVQLVYRRNKTSLVYPFLGVYTKFCFVLSSQIYYFISYKSSKGLFICWRLFVLTYVQIAVVLLPLWPDCSLIYLLTPSTLHKTSSARKYKLHRQLIRPRLPLCHHSFFKNLHKLFHFSDYTITNYSSLKYTWPIV